MVTGSTAARAIIELSLLDRVSGGLKGVQANLDRIGQNLKNVGRRMTLGVTTPIVGLGASIIHTAGQFETSMNRVQALSGATGEEFDALRQQARELGAATQFSASQAGEAMGFLAMAGFEAQDILGAMPATLQLAASAQLDLGNAADIVSNILTGYGKNVEELGHVTDVLTKAFTSANTDLSQLGEAMKFAGPVASAAGVEFEEAAAAMALMGNAGIQGSMAGTSLRGALTRILDPTDRVYGTMKRLGLQFTDSGGRLKSMEEIIRQLEPHAEDAGLFMQLFGQRAGPAMAALVSQGSDALRDMTGELRDSAGTAERISAVQMQGFEGAVKELRSAFEGLQIAIAESGLLETVTEVVKSVTEFVRNLSETSPELLRLGTIIAGVAAAAGPLLWVVGTLITNFTALAGVFVKLGAVILTTPFGWILAMVALVAGSVYIIYDSWDDIADWFAGKLDAVADAFGDGFLPGVTELFRQFNPFRIWWEAMQGLVNYLFGIDLAGWLRRQVRDVARSILPSWLADRLGLGGEDEEDDLPEAGELDRDIREAGREAARIIEGDESTEEGRRKTEEERRIARHEASERRRAEREAERERERAERQARRQENEARINALKAEAQPPPAPDASELIEARQIDAAALNIDEPIVVHRAPEVHIDASIGELHLTMASDASPEQIYAEIERRQRRQRQEALDEARSALSD